jgi:hypothetical protein
MENKTIVQNAIDKIKNQGLSEYSGGYVDKKALQIAVNALELQLPKEPVVKSSDNEDFDEAEDFDMMYHCPTCGKLLQMYEHHCICGQTLNWDNI